MSLLEDDACENDDVDQAIKLIEKGYEANEPDEDGFTPLVYVVFVREVDACDALIGNQAGINVQAQDGYDRIAVPMGMGVQFDRYSVNAWRDSY